MTYTVKSVRLEPVQSTAASVKELVIAHIGDSFTSTVYLRFEERLDSLLQTLFAANAPKLKVRNVNLGADGEYLQEMIDTGRYEKAIHQQYARIDVAVIRYGGNDSRKYSPAEFVKWLGVLSDKISKDYPGVKIMIGTGIWLKGDDDVNKRQYGAYWQASRDFAAARKFPLADIAEAFEEANSHGLTIGKGDMHPSAEGVRLVALTEFKVLKALLGL